MTNRKNTKRALLMSVMGLLICVSMLVGTSFAWFTDSVGTVENIIAAGNLDIELEYSKTMEENSWSSVQGQSDLVDPNARWEPGHTEVVYLRITNKGSLALKYQLRMSVVNAVVGKSVLGNDIALADYLKYDIVEVTEKYETRDDARKAVEATAENLAAYSVSGQMTEQGESKTMALVVYMPETVGNEANYRGGAVPTIALGLNLVAAQFTYEKDSFDELYDKNAGWLGNVDTDWYFENPEAAEFTITTAEELAGLAAIVNGTAIAPAGTFAAESDATVQDSFAGQTVKLGNSIDLGGANWTAIGTKAAPFKGTFDGAGYTISNLRITASVYAGLFGYAYVNTEAAPTTIRNLTVDGVEATAIANAEYDAYAGAVLAYATGASEMGKVNVSGVSVRNAVLRAKNVGSVAGSFGVLGNVTDCKAVSCDLSGSRIGGIVGTMGEASALSGCSVEDISKTIVMAGDESAVYTGVYVGRPTSAAVQDGNDAVCESVISSDAALDQAIKAGKETLYLSEGTYIVPDSAARKTLTIVGNGKTNLAVQDDGSYEGGDYSLDGATVTFENVTITTVDGNYRGYIRCVATFNNCVFNNTYTAFADSQFNNCTFNVSGDKYNLWTWGAHNIAFDNCTFNCDGKAVLVYNGTTVCDLTATNCVFNDNGDDTVTGKAAIETGDDQGEGNIRLTLTNVTVNGFAVNPQGIVSGSTAWANKNAMPTERLTVVIDGVDVY